MRGHRGHQLVAGTIATVLVTLFAPLVAEYAVQLGRRSTSC